jgi:hypothetical protein
MSVPGTKGQARSGRDGAGLGRDADGSQAVGDRAPERHLQRPDRTPPNINPSAVSPSPGGFRRAPLCLRWNLSGGLRRAPLVAAGEGRPAFGGGLTAWTVFRSSWLVGADGRSGGLG